ncbi:hypothetical protein OG225_10055 [Nocardia sp. NBC_01377]
MLEISEDLTVLRDCHIVLTATNSAVPLLTPDLLATDHSVLVYDLAVPGDVHPDVADLPGAPDAFAAMTCPDFHNTRDVPLTELSTQLKAFSVGCDEISILEMKATAMYLQMTLFGPVERHFLDTWSPDVLVFEHHPLIELQVYGPLYMALAGPDWNGHDREHEIAAVQERHRPGTFDDILAWQHSQAARLGSARDIWSLLSEIADLVGRNITASVAGFAARFRTTLPDACSGSMFRPSRQWSDARCDPARAWRRRTRRRNVWRCCARDTCGFATPWPRHSPRSDSIASTPPTASIRTSRFAPV